MGSDGHVIREAGYDYGVVERWAGALSFISYHRVIICANRDLHF